MAKYTKPKSVKRGDLYTTSKSNFQGIVTDIHARGNRKVVEMTVLGSGETAFSTIERGVRATVTA